jgi:hypothetical protein
MKIVIASTIAALGVGLGSTAFAAETGIKVSPSSINLDAEGVTTVTIHTLANYAPPCEATVSVEEDASLPSYMLTFVNDELSLFADNVGHLVARIETWSMRAASEGVVQSTAIFKISGECSGEGADEGGFDGMDTARITENFSEKKGND